MRLWNIWFIITLITLSCFILFLTYWNISPYNKNQKTKEDYEIYSIIIRTITNGKLVILKDHTKEGEIVKDEEIKAYVLRELFELKHETLKNFYLKNKFSIFLNEQILRRYKINCRLIDSEEFERIFGENTEKGWKVFYTKYPGSCGIITVSRVGFDKGKKQAFVYITHTSGSLCGYGMYVLLTKKRFLWKDYWVIQRKVVVWIA